MDPLPCEATALDLSRLRALHAVSVHGSVAGAAVALGYTPSAVSQQITTLERETRTILLERRGRGVSLTEEALHLVDAAQQLLAGREAVRREELARERWICQPPGTVCHDWLTRTVRTAGYEPDIRHRAEEHHTQLALVAAGLGVAMIPRLGRGTLPAGVVAVRLDPVTERRLYALWRTEAARRPAITAAVAALQTHGAAAGLE
ncbi:LysR family transcriptional regulator [Streptomyces cyaneofuscatus]|uniref:LysR family transcriptional regulator n=1 Tax=Streptomyces cyaneofuscatus TaxID=66883 RepID=UPI00365D257A